MSKFYLKVLIPKYLFLRINKILLTYKLSQFTLRCCLLINLKFSYALHVASLLSAIPFKLSLITEIFKSYAHYSNFDVAFATTVALAADNLACSIVKVKYYTSNMLYNNLQNTNFRT